MLRSVCTCAQTDQHNCYSQPWHFLNQNLQPRGIAPKAVGIKKTEHEDRFSHDRALMHNFLGIDTGNTIGFFI